MHMSTSIILYIVPGRVGNVLMETLRLLWVMCVCIRNASQFNVNEALHECYSNGRACTPPALDKPTDRSKNRV